MEFSDDLFVDADAVMQRVGSFLGLTSYNYSTSTAYNTEKRRGAYINVATKAHAGAGAGGQGRGRADKTVKSNEASAASVATQRSSAANKELDVLTQLMQHSVAQLQAVLADGHWAAPELQFRRAVPPKWRERYGLSRA